jgi:hypothetical protein
MRIVVALLSAGVSTVVMLIIALEKKFHRKINIDVIRGIGKFAATLF